MKVDSLHATWKVCRDQILKAKHLYQAQKFISGSRWNPKFDEVVLKEQMACAFGVQICHHGIKFWSKTPRLFPSLARRKRCTIGNTPGTSCFSQRRELDDDVFMFLQKQKTAQSYILWWWWWCLDDVFYLFSQKQKIGAKLIYTFRKVRTIRGCLEGLALMMMSFIYSCRNKK